MPTKLKLVQAQQEWLTHLTASGASVGTFKAYKGTTDALLRVTGDIYALHVTPQHIDRFFLVHSAWGPSTRNSHLSHIRSFFGFCRARGWMHRDTDPTFGWRKLKVPKPESPRIPVAEWGKLFAATRHPQEGIVLATGLYLFLRASEQKRIQLKHIHLDTQEIEVFRQKTQDWDLMPISAELDGHIRAHLSWMSSQWEPHPDHYLCPSRLANQSRDERAKFNSPGDTDPTKPINLPYRTVQRILGRAGYPTEKQGEHTLRRSGARAYFDSLVAQGFDGALRRVQSMLGHESTESTEVYLGLDGDRYARNKDLKGQLMFPGAVATNVVPIRREIG